MGLFSKKQKETGDYEDLKMYDTLIYRHYLNSNNYYLIDGDGKLANHSLNQIKNITIGKILKKINDLKIDCEIKRFSTISIKLEESYGNTIIVCNKTNIILVYQDNIMYRLFGNSDIIAPHLLNLIRMLEEYLTEYNKQIQEARQLWGLGNS